MEQIEVLLSHFYKYSMSDWELLIRDNSGGIFYVPWYFRFYQRGGEWRSKFNSWCRKRYIQWRKALLSHQRKGCLYYLRIVSVVWIVFATNFLSSCRVDFLNNLHTPLKYRKCIVIKLLSCKPSILRSLFIEMDYCVWIGQSTVIGKE